MKTVVLASHDYFSQPKSPPINVPIKSVDQKFIILGFWEGFERFLGLINTNFHQFGNQKQSFGAVLVVKLHFFHQIGPQRPQNNEWPNQEAQLVPFEMLLGFKNAHQRPFH